MTVPVASRCRRSGSIPSVRPPPPSRRAAFGKRPKYTRSPSSTRPISASSHKACPSPPSSRPRTRSCTGRSSSRLRHRVSRSWPPRTHTTEPSSAYRTGSAYERPVRLPRTVRSMTELSSTPENEDRSSHLTRPLACRATQPTADDLVSSPNAWTALASIASLSPDPDSLPDDPAPISSHPESACTVEWPQSPGTKGQLPAREVGGDSMWCCTSATAQRRPHCVSITANRSTLRVGSPGGVLRRTLACGRHARAAR
jgi:hypothetical protein